MFEDEFTTIHIQHIALCVSAASCLFSAFSLYKNATSTTNDAMLEHSVDAIKQLDKLNATLVNVEKHSSVIVNKIDSVLVKRRQSKEMNILNIGNEVGK